jgi:hypothetical protein
MEVFWKGAISAELRKNMCNTIRSRAHPELRQEAPAQHPTLFLLPQQT